MKNGRKEGLFHALAGHPRKNDQDTQNFQNQGESHNADNNIFWLLYVLRSVILLNNGGITERKATAWKK